MKVITTLVASLLFAGVAFSLHAAEKPAPGPKGGKLLNNPSPRAEFFVDKDRKVVLSFYGNDLKPVPVGEQSAAVWADARSGRVKLTMEKKDDALVSTEPLPAGDGYHVMVQLKSNPDAKAQSFKINFHDEPCDKCKRAEYACVCEDGHDHGHSGPGHEH